MNFQGRPRHMYQQNRGGYILRGRGYRHGFRGRPPFNEDNQNSEFWCETCDRAFRSHILLENHKKEHMKCAIDGCQFIAHPKVITKHIEMQHSTGLYNRIGNLNNPEAIQKWREERKKRYPTKENIDKKQLELKEKVNRGEKMGLQNKMRPHTDPNSRKRDQFKRNSNVRGNKRKSTNQNNMQNKKVKKPEPEMIIPADNRKLKPFAGIQNLIFSDEETEVESIDFSIPIEDDEFELGTRITEVHTDKEKQNASVCGALSCLIMNYDSSDDEECSNKEVDNELKSKDPKRNVNNVDSSLGKQERLQPIQPLEVSNNDFTRSIQPTDITQNKNSEIVIKSTVQPSSKENVTSSQQCVNNNKDESEDSGPEEIQCQKPANEMTPTSLDNTNTIKNTINKRREKTLPPQRKREYIKKTKLPSTLLVKLLGNEIRHERNIILQCVRYIVKNNFNLDT